VGSRPTHGQCFARSRLRLRYRVRRSGMRARRRTPRTRSDHPAARAHRRPRVSARRRRHDAKDHPQALRACVVNNLVGMVPVKAKVAAAIVEKVLFTPAHLQLGPAQPQVGNLTGDLVQSRFAVVHGRPVRVDAVLRGAARRRRDRPGRRRWRHGRGHLRVAGDDHDRQCAERLGSLLSRHRPDTLLASSSGAFMLAEMSLVSPTLTTPTGIESGAPSLRPDMNANTVSAGQSHAPEFLTRQVLVNAAFFSILLLSGMVTSATNPAFNWQSEAVVPGAVPGESCSSHPRSERVRGPPRRRRPRPARARRPRWKR